MVTKTPRLLATAVPACLQTPTTLARRGADAQMVTKTPRLLPTAVPACLRTPTTLVRRGEDGNQDAKTPRLMATAVPACLRTPTTLVRKGADGNQNAKTQDWWQRPLSLASRHQRVLSGERQMVTKTPRLVATAVPARFRTPTTLVQRGADGNQNLKTGGNGRSCLPPDTNDSCPERGRW